MKEKSGAWVKTLVLILSINLFVCGDIVTCTESVSKFFNSLFGDEIISIINPCDKPEFKTDTKYGYLADFEATDEYWKLFNKCFENIVIVIIDFEMDKNEEKKKKFFSSLRNRDISYTFRNPYDTNLPDTIKKIFLESIKQISEEKNKFAYPAIENEDEKYTKETFCVITQSTYLKNIINDIEFSIHEVFKDGEYISYSFCFLNTEPFQFDNNTFTNAYNIKRIDNLNITPNNESGNKNEEAKKQLQFGHNILDDPDNIENGNSNIINNNNKRIGNINAINNKSDDKNEEAQNPFQCCYKLKTITCTKETCRYIFYSQLKLTHEINFLTHDWYHEISCKYKKEENNANNINNNLNNSNNPFQGIDLPNNNINNNNLDISNNLLSENRQAGE